MRQTTSTDTNLILAAVSGRSFGTKLYKTKGSAWPFYYGIQPTGRYPDEPFVKELYYDGANPIILHRVPSRGSACRTPRRSSGRRLRRPSRPPTRPTRP